jgi:hypothetical protein
LMLHLRPAPSGGRAVLGLAAWGAVLLLVSLLSSVPLACRSTQPELTATRSYSLVPAGDPEVGTAAGAAEPGQRMLFFLTAAEAAAPYARLELGALAGARSLWLNGEPVGGMGFDLVQPIELAGRLRQGRNELLLLPAAAAAGGAGALVPPLLDLSEVPLEAVLTLSPATSLGKPSILATERPGIFEVRCAQHGAPADSHLEVRLVDGGGILAEAHSAVQPGPIQTVPLAVPETALWKPGAGQVPLPWLSVRLVAADGETQDLVASRVGIADLRYGADGLYVNGSPVRVWASLFFERGGDARETLGRIVPKLHRAGLNALETHGWVPDRAMVEAAEELGLYLVVLPRCPARVQREYHEQMPTAVQGVLNEAVSVEIQRLEQSPTLVLWEREKPWLWLAGAQRPAAMTDLDVPRSQAVTVGFSVGHRELEFRSVPDGAPPAWVIEIIPEDPAHRVPLSAEGAAEGMARWRESGALGLVLGHVEQECPVFELPDEILDRIAAGRPADVPASLPSRGPASLVVRVSRGGTPVEGATVDVVVDELPPWSTFTDARGEARLRIWWEGPAQLRAEGLVEAIELEGGRYDGDGWSPNPQEILLELEP